MGKDLRCETGVFFSRVLVADAPMSSFPLSYHRMDESDSREHSQSSSVRVRMLHSVSEVVGEEGTHEFQGRKRV